MVLFGVLRGIIVGLLNWDPGQEARFFAVVLNVFLGLVFEVVTSMPRRVTWDPFQAG